MDRLVDYFAVVGCDQIEDGADEIEGKVTTRIPEQDWPENPFIPGIELFCQPTGWFLTQEKDPPKYFVAVLTDEYGKRRYLAVLSFCEPIHEKDTLSDGKKDKISRRESSKYRQNTKGNNEEVDESMCVVYVDEESQDSSDTQSSSNDQFNRSMKEAYAPKCLVLISRHAEFAVFKVLRPIPALCRLTIWSYFTREALADCPIYDGLLGEFFSTKSSPNDQDSPEAGEGWGIQSGRRVVNPGYDNVFEVQPNAISSLKHQIDCLLRELDEEPMTLEEILTRPDSKDTKKMIIPTSVQLSRSEAEMLSKRFSSAVTTHNVSQDQYSDVIMWRDSSETLKPGDFDLLNSSSIYQLQTTSSEVRTHEGTLWKQGNLMGRWKQRYFVLDSTKHQVESVKLISPMPGAPKGSFFELKTAKRVFHYVAENDEAALKWTEVLQNALEA